MEKKYFVLLNCVCLLSCALGLPQSNLFRAMTVKKCGKSILPNSFDRIIGGRQAEHGQYPWMISIHANYGEGFGHICGGAILNENWVVTAAHCMHFDNVPQIYRIIAGLHKLSRNQTSTVEILKVDEIFLHESYNSDTDENDIALIKTAKPINFSASKGYINGICLPKTDEDPTGYATVIGWGLDHENGINSDTLKEVVIPIIPRDVCNSSYDDKPYDGVDEIKKTMICAGMPKKDSCRNDSGGPLFQTSSAGVSTLIGVVSFGNGCGGKYYPGVYTKVSSYRNWMEKIMSK